MMMFGLAADSLRLCGRRRGFSRRACAQSQSRTSRHSRHQELPPVESFVQTLLFTLVAHASSSGEGKKAPRRTVPV